MNRIPKLLGSALGLVLATSLACFTVPALAAKSPPPDKLYGVEFLLPTPTFTAPDGSVVVNPAYQQPAGDNVNGDLAIKPPVYVVVYLKNESPPSSAASNIGSARFDLSPSLVLVADPVCPRAQCSISGNTVTVTNISPPIQAQQVYPITLQVNTCVVAGEASISNLHLFNGSQLTGSEFKPVSTDEFFRLAQTLSTRSPLDFTQKIAPVVTGISCGNIACNQPFSIGNQDPTTQTYKFINGWRGLNKDGTCSGTTNLPYFVTNQLGASSVADQLVHFTWPSDSNSPQVFAYKLTRNADTQGTGVWNLGWLLSNGELVTIPAPICNGGLLQSEPTTIAGLPLPSVYGLLSQDVQRNSNKIKVDTTNPPTISPDGLPIVIQGERMLVTSIDSSGWSVSRTVKLFHPAGSPVASTPMPLLASVTPPYANGDPAKMCMAWTDGTSAWIIDESDGWGVPR